MRARDPINVFISVQPDGSTRYYRRTPSGAWTETVSEKNPSSGGCMKVIQDDLWLCQDCTMYAVNGDTSGIESEKREREVVEGVNSLGPHLVPDFGDDGEGEEEFSRTPCDACGTRLAGSRTRFAILGEENPVVFGLSGMEVALIAAGVGVAGVLGYFIWKANWSPAAQGGAAWVASQAATSPAISVASGSSPTVQAVRDPSQNFCSGPGQTQSYCWQDSGNTSVPSVGQPVAVMIYDTTDAQGNQVTPTSSPCYGTVTAVDSNNNVTLYFIGTPDQLFQFPLSYVVTGLQLVGAAVGA